MGYPGIEAIFDAFGIVVDCIERFEISLRATLHIALPAEYHMMQKLDDVSCRKKAWRGEFQPLAHPSVYSRELSSVMRNCLYAVKWDHPLLLVECFLNPLFLEMEFIVDTHQRAEYRTKAEKCARGL